MFNFLRDLYYKFRKWLFNKAYKEQITVKGLYFYLYLKKILTKEWKKEDYVQSYEDAIEDFQKQNALTREQTVYYYFLYLNEILAKSEEKYGEEPVIINKKEA